MVRLILFQDLGEIVHFLCTYMILTVRPDLASDLTTKVGHKTYCKGWLSYVNKAVYIELYNCS